jgi:hypothetical protein
MGRMAGCAAIHGTSFGQNGGSGRASSLEPLSLSKDTSPHDLSLEALAAYIGARSEARLGSGDECSSPGERLEAFILASHADDLAGAKGALFIATFAGADALIDACRDEILGIADILERRRMITRGHCEKHLTKVRAGGLPPLISRHELQLNWGIGLAQRIKS